MTEDQLFQAMKWSSLLLLIAPAALPALGRFGAKLRLAAIVVYLVAVGIAATLAVLYFLG